MDSKTNLLKLMIKTKKGFPNKTIIYILVLLTKLLPLFILTHDWNINYGRGIGYILSYFTLGLVVSQINNHACSGSIMIILLVITILPLCCYFFTYSHLKNYNKLFSIHKKCLVICSFILFYFIFFINQHFYMLLIANFLCKGLIDEKVPYPLIISYDETVNSCRDPFNYVIIGIQSILLIYYLIVSYFIALLSFDPFFTSQNVISNSLNSYNLKWLIFPLIQGILQLEFHIPFTIVIYIKAITRGIFLMFYVKHIYSEIRNFYTHWIVFFCVNFLFSMCFISCIIEFGFLYDLDNHLTILQKDISSIIFKLLIEICGAYIILKFIEKKERKHLQDFYNIIGKSSCMQYEYVNKFYYYLYHGHDIDLLKCLLNKFAENVDIHKKEKKCIKTQGYQCYCEIFTLGDYYSQSNKFLYFLKNTLKANTLSHGKLLKTTFPVLYAFLEYCLLSNLEKYQGTRNNLLGDYLLISVIFYMVFDNNYTRSLFFLEEFTKTSKYRQSFIIRVQVKLFKMALIKGYKQLIKRDLYDNINISTASDENKAYSEMHQSYKSLEKNIYVEQNIKESLKCYLELLNKFNDTEVKYETFTLLLKKLEVQMKINESVLQHYSSLGISTTQTEMKIAMYNKFFKNTDMKSLKNITDYYAFNRKERHSIIILNSNFEKSQLLFKIEYASDDLCSHLGYSFEELRLKDLNDILPKFVVKSYNYLFLKTIKKGEVKVSIREFCIIGKDTYAKLFHFAGIVLFVGDKLKLYAKVQPIFPSHLTSPFKKIQKKNKSMQINDICFLFANKNGQITSISEEFEKYFTLNISLIKKVKLNIFKDILKIENTSKGGSITKDLHDIYNNIADLNLSQIFESSNDEFSKTYFRVKEIQKKLARINIPVVCDIKEKCLNTSDDKRKDFFFVLFTIDFGNVNTTVFLESWLGSEWKIEDGNTAEGSINYQKISTKPYNHVLPLEMTSFLLNEDYEDIFGKIKLVRNISIRLLSINYGINRKDLVPCHENSEISPAKKHKVFDTYKFLNQTHVKEDTQKNNSNTATIGEIGFSLSRKSLIGRNVDTHEKLKNQLSRRIVRQMAIWIFGLILFLLLLQMLNAYYSQLMSVCDSNIQAHAHLAITKNIMIGMISSVLYMQFQINGLQGTIIDNNFDNSYSLHQKYLKARTQDYISYFKRFQNYYKETIGFQGTQIIETILNEDYSFSTLGIDNKSSISKSTLWDTLYFFHLTCNNLWRKKLDPLYFNVTNDSNQHFYQGEAFAKYQQREVSSVFLIENYLTTIKYPLDEILNVYPDIIQNHSKYISSLMITLNIGASLFLLVLFIIQSVVYYSINNVIFAKYFITFNYLRYFNEFLCKKTLILQDFIDNSEEIKLVKLQHTLVAIKNSAEEHSKLLKTLSDNMENPKNFTIKPFSVNVSMLEPVKMTNAKNANTEESYLGITSPNDSKLSSLLSKTPCGLSLIQIQSINKKSIAINNVSCKPPLHIPSNITNNSRASLNQTDDNFFGKTALADLSQMPETGDDTLMSKSIARLKSPTKPPEKYQQYLSNLSTTKNNINKTTLNLFNRPYSTFELSSNKKQMHRPRSFFINLIAFIGFAIFISFISIGNFALTSVYLNFQKSLSKYNQIIYQRICMIEELLLIYQISILKNEEITYTYASHGYLNTSMENSYLNSYTVHDVFEEEVSNFNYYFTGVANLTNGNEDTIFTKVEDYEKSINTESFCEKYSQFYFDNIDNILIPKLTLMKNISEVELRKDCMKIGNGFNAKGLITAMESLFTSIKSMYKDFQNDPKRTGESNYKRLNDPFIQTYQAEMDFLFDKLFVNYFISLIGDYQNDVANIKLYESVFQAFIMILIIILGFFYIWKLSYHFQRDDSMIEYVEDIIINTLVF